MAKGLEFGMTKQQRVREIEDRDEAQAEIIEKYGRAKVGRAIKEFCWVCKDTSNYRSIINNSSIPPPQFTNYLPNFNQLFTKVLCKNSSDVPLR